MQSADYWRLCDDLSIFQAIMLILGYDPAQQDSGYVEYNQIHSAPEGYSALKTAICNAVKFERIEAEIYFGQDDYGNIHDDAYIDINKTHISVEKLKQFLKEKGIVEGFFFPQGGIFEAYLDSQNSCFAPKLSAAVHAWKAVSESPDLLNGKTPKQALEKWLRENASQYGLTKEDGSPNETGIEEICKIANWKPEGGAAKTPTGGTVQAIPPTLTLNPRKLKVFGERNQSSYQESSTQNNKTDELEDEIPF